MSTNAPTQPKAKSHFQTLDKLRCDLDGLKVKGYTYPEIGALRGISGGLAWSIINEGYDPKSPQIRKRLNLPPLTAEAPVCPDCGRVHVTPWCTEKDGPPVKPKQERPKRKRKPRTDRATINTNSAESAARTLLNKTSSAYRQELIRILSGKEQVK